MLQALPKPVVRTTSAAATGRVLLSVKNDGGSTHADDRRRRFEPHGVRRDLGDLTGDIRRHALHHLQHEAEAAFGGSERKTVEAHFTVRSQRQPRVVFQGDADLAVVTRSQRVCLVDGLPDLCGNGVRASDDHHGA